MRKGEAFLQRRAGAEVLASRQPTLVKRVLAWNASRLLN